MKNLLGLVGIGALCLSVVMLGNSSSALHEIEAGIGFLISVVAMGAAGVIESVDRLRAAVAPGQANVAPSGKRACVNCGNIWDADITECRSCGGKDLR